MRGPWDDALFYAFQDLYDVANTRRGTDPGEGSTRAGRNVTGEIKQILEKKRAQIG